MLMEDRVMWYRSVLIHNTDSHLFPPSNNEKVHKEAKLCCCGCRANFSMCMQPKGSCKTSTAPKQAEPLISLREDYFILYGRSTPGEQAVDLPTHGTDQHCDPLCCLLNPFYLAKTSGLSKAMQKTSPLLQVIQNLE